MSSLLYIIDFSKYGYTIQGYNQSADINIYFLISKTNEMACQMAILFIQQSGLICNLYLFGSCLCNFVLQQNYSMKARPKSAKSAFEVSFETQQTFQRNKQFIDIEKLSTHDREYSAMRRKPLASEDNHISEKINSSFLNTTAELTERAHKNISKHKSKNTFFANSPSTLQSEWPTQESSPLRPSRGRSFSIEKMTSREYHHKLKNKAVNDERRFNNFEKFKATVPIYCDYEKMTGQKGETVKPFPELQYNTQKLYEEYYYKRTTNNCKVDYKSQKKLKHERVFFSPKKAQNLAATDLDPQKVDHGLKIATCFKQSNITRGNIEQFYRNSGRELPCQTQMRHMNELTNYWKDEHGGIKRKKMDFETKQMKERQQNQRAMRIQYSKAPRLKRQQMCDQKFFRHFKL